MDPLPQTRKLTRRLNNFPARPSQNSDPVCASFCVLQALLTGPLQPEIKGNWLNRSVAFGSLCQHLSHLCSQVRITVTVTLPITGHRGPSRTFPGRVCRALLSREGTAALEILPLHETPAIRKAGTDVMLDSSPPLPASTGAPGGTCQLIRELSSFPRHS